MAGDDAWNIVTLKEHFEALLRERDKALVNQHAEYERRLSVLNHAHEEARRVQATYVTEEKFQAFVDRFEENKTVTGEALTLARGNQQGWTRSGRAIVSALTGSSLLLGIVVLLANGKL